jgi:DNA polymerase-3 subunit epsilon
MEVYVLFDPTRIAEIIRARTGQSDSQQLAQLLNNPEFQTIYEHVRDNPGCLQSTLGRRLGVYQSRVGTYLQRATKLRIVRRENAGNSYRLFDALLEAEQGNTASETKSQAETTSPGVGCFVDTETTGLQPDEHELIELALILFEFDRASGEIFRITDEYVGQRCPNRSIPQAATRVHGITRRDLKGRQMDGPRVESILQRAELIVAHNAEFDRAFIERLFPACAEKVWKCSMRGVDWHSYGFRSRKLQSLLLRHKIRPGVSHRADADAKAALELLSKTGPNGRPYFAELLHGSPTVRPRVISTRMKDFLHDRQETDASAVLPARPMLSPGPEYEEASRGGRAAGWIIALIAALILLACWALTR